MNVLALNHLLLGASLSSLAVNGCLHFNENQPHAVAHVQAGKPKKSKKMHTAAEFGVNHLFV